MLNYVLHIVGFTVNLPEVHSIVFALSKIVYYYYNIVGTPIVMDEELAHGSTS